MEQLGADAEHYESELQRILEADPSVTEEEQDLFARTMLLMVVADGSDKDFQLIRDMLVAHPRINTLLRTHRSIVGHILAVRRTMMQVNKNPAFETILQFPIQAVFDVGPFLLESEAPTPADESAAPREPESHTVPAGESDSSTEPQPDAPRSGADP
eukprot:gnl/Trimastix_PCT/4962.p1 GENE.gnl/Trimastix_PCT/4962~~gnl/Trimastix_PCT/4962.p1  ORF type:complete len:157 (-),score=34.41 gnl/Trimastix_PCT/4962:329-799(-)